MMTMRMLQEDREWKLDWIKRNIEWCREKADQDGKITVDARFLEQLFSENLGWYQNVLYLQQRLVEQLAYQNSPMQHIVMPDAKSVSP